MLPVFSTSQIRKVDDTAINQLHYPGIMLMENAARSIYDIVVERFKEINTDTVIGIVCGKGNNGGDGFAVARHFFINGFKVKVVHIAGENELSADAKVNFRILNHIKSAGLQVKKYKSIKDLNFLKDCKIIFDALLGSGTTGELKSPYLEIIQKLNEFKAIKVAVDIPTGLNADTGYGNPVFKADLTVTLGEFKKGLFFGEGYAYSGEIIKGSIGIPQPLFDDLSVNEYLIEPEDAYIGLPQKDKNINKYTAGKVLCICGSEKYTGAALLTSLSALKIGTGATILCFPKSVRNLVHSKHLELVIYNYEDYGKGFLTEKSVDDISSKIAWADCIALGSGIGRDKGTMKAVIKILKKFKNKNMILDADAIFALSNGNYRKVNLKNKILTPHYGEFANLVGIETNELEKDLILYGKKFVYNTGSYLVLKGPRTLIFNPNGEVFINTTGNAGMAKFGSGDVLTGILAGLVGQNKKVENSLILGVFLHGLTGDLLKEEQTVYGYTASQLINKFPRTIKFLEGSNV
jgi:NAD(P)H-hydrate epimerase